MKIAVLGNNLQSQVAGVLFASVGNQVVLFENKNSINFDSNEPGLFAIYQEQILCKRLQYLEENSDTSIFDFVISSGVKSEEIFDKYKHELLPSAQKGTKIILLNPSEIGEAQQLLSKTIHLSNKVTVSSIPLLVREGVAINDFSRPINIIVGCDDAYTLSKIKILFHPFNRLKDVIKHVSSREAEFSSFAGNAMLATRLSFMNEMASLAERSDVDINVVRDCIGRDPRIGNDYLYPGCGYGGKALVENVMKVARELRFRSDDLGLLEIVQKINERQKDLLFRKIWRFFNSNLNDKTVALWGVAFKPGSSSIEDAASIKLIESLLAQSTTIRVYDPWALTSLANYFGNNSNLVLVQSASEALEGADILAICTEWKEFWNPDFDLIECSLKNKAIFDGRNIYDPNVMMQRGIQYFGIGCGESV